MTTKKQKLVNIVTLIMALTVAFGVGLNIGWRTVPGGGPAPMAAMEESGLTMAEPDPAAWEVTIYHGDYDLPEDEATMIVTRGEVTVSGGATSNVLGVAGISLTETYKFLLVANNE